MKLFVLNDQVVREILRSLTVEDETLDLIEKIIHRFDTSFSSFVYSMFSAYTTYYVQLNDTNCHLNYREAQSIYTELSRTNLNVDHSNVFVADIYDILYVNSAFDKTRFKHYFYEDFYNRAENILGAVKALSAVEDLFDALETMFTAIEQNLVSHLIERSESDCNVVIYFELGHHGLMIYVI